MAQHDQPSRLPHTGRDAEDEIRAEREALERSRRPSGLDERYSGAGYAGPGGYGGGFGGENKPRERDAFDPDYRQWRREQEKQLDDDYRQFRQDRFKKFSDEFSQWRSGRSRQAEPAQQDTGSTSSRQRNDGS